MGWNRRISGWNRRIWAGTVEFGLEPYVPQPLIYALQETMSNRGNGSKCVVAGGDGAGIANSYLAKAKARAAVAKAVTPQPREPPKASSQAAPASLKRSHPLPKGSPASPDQVSPGPKATSPSSLPTPKATTAPKAATPGPCASTQS